jgi:hypothetical protein
MQAGGMVWTISHTAMFYPQSRVFALTMQSEAWGLLLVLPIRSTYYKVLSDSRAGKCSAGVWRSLLLLWTVVCPIGLILVSVTTVHGNGTLHFVGAGGIFVGAVLFSIFSDFALRSAGAVIGMNRWVIDWLNFTIGVVFPVFQQIGDSADGDENTVGSAKIPWAITFSSLCQYVMAIMAFVRIFLFYWDLPGQKLVVSCEVVENRVGDDQDGDGGIEE